MADADATALADSAVAWISPCKTREEMWQRVRAEYDLNLLPASGIARLTKIWDPTGKGASEDVIRARAKKQGWPRSAKKTSQDQIKARAHELGMPSLFKPHGPAPGGDPVSAEAVKDSLGSGVAPTDLQRKQALENATALQLSTIRSHRTTLNKIRAITDSLLEKLEAAVVRGEGEIKIIQRKEGRETIEEYQLAFLGERESVSDVLQKVALSLSKLIPLERQSVGMTDAPGDNKPPLIINIGGVRIGGHQTLREKFAAGKPRPLEHGQIAIEEPGSG